MPPFHSTTVLAVRRGERAVLAGDGQVTLGDTVVKALLELFPAEITDVEKIR